MNEEKLEELVQSYGIEHILVELDLDPSWVLTTLIELGHIDERDLYDIYY